MQVVVINISGGYHLASGGYHLANGGCHHASGGYHHTSDVHCFLYDILSSHM